MNYKRAIGIIILMVLTPFIFSITMSFLFDTDLAVTKASDLNNMTWLAANILVLVIAAIGTLFYFKPAEVEANPKRGFAFGLLVILFGVLSNILAFLPYEGGLEIYRTYFIQPFFWSAFLLILLTSTAVGYIKADQN